MGSCPRCSVVRVGVDLAFVEESARWRPNPQSIKAETRRLVPRPQSHGWVLARVACDSHDVQELTTAWPGLRLSHVLSVWASRT